MSVAIAACGGDDSPTTPAASDTGQSPPPTAGAPSGGSTGGSTGAPSGGSSGGSTGAPSGGSSGGSAGNGAPTISGKPVTAVVQDTPYSFRPEASDPDGDKLTFKIANMPKWATFNAADGLLKGTPKPADLGVYENIVISVSDGQAEASLDAFSITVQQVGNGSAVLSWVPPTENTDGTPLTDLAGYKLYWGTSPGDYPNSVSIDNAGITTYVVENLVPATYYFVATAINAEGTESEPSNTAMSTIL